MDELAVTQGSTVSQSVRIPGVQKVTARSHGRTSDLLAGGLGRAHGGEKSMLWVCEMCFKYMADNNSYELHVVCFPPFSTILDSDLVDIQKSCNVRHPPGRKVYQRGAHTIWEIDGAEHKVKGPVSILVALPYEYLLISFIVKTYRCSENFLLM